MTDGHFFFFQVLYRCRNNQKWSILNNHHLNNLVVKVWCYDSPSHYLFVFVFFMHSAIKREICLTGAAALVKLHHSLHIHNTPASARPHLHFIGLYYASNCFTLFWREKVIKQHVETLIYRKWKHYLMPFYFSEVSVLTFLSSPSHSKGHHRWELLSSADTESPAPSRATRPLQWPYLFPIYLGPYHDLQLLLCSAPTKREIGEGQMMMNSSSWWIHTIRLNSTIRAGSFFFHVFLHVVPLLAFIIQPNVAMFWPMCACTVYNLNYSI